MLIKFICNNSRCKNSIDKFFKRKEDVPHYLDCGSCGVGKLERSLGAPSSKGVQVIDNGIQQKQVEVMNIVVEREEELVRKKNDK